MVESYTGEVDTKRLEPAGLRVKVFYNNYPSFMDTNNLSLLIFLDVGILHFVLSGDLERPGWLKLLENREVKSYLSKVNVFIASHHGRESGYCNEVFEYCKPQVVVISDGPIQHDTQRMASIYAQHASGIMFNTASGQEPCKVLTTRKDGNIYWDL